MILLNSVGTALTRKLITHPINEDGTIPLNLNKLYAYFNKTTFSLSTIFLML